MITRAECVDHRLVRRGEQTPASVAIVAPGRTPLTSLALSREIRTIGARLNAMGVRRRDRIAIVLPTGPDMAVTCLGVAACATSAPLNPAYLTNELEFYLSDLKAAALVTSSTTKSPAREVADALHIPVVEVSSIGDAAVGGDAAAGVFDLRGPSRAAPVSGTPANPDDVALVLHTSGTTSRPKIVPLTHANLCLAADNMTRALALRETDRCLNVAHLFHIHGLMATLAALLSGGSVAFLPPLDVSRFFQYLEDLRPTWYTGVPTIHHAVLAGAAAHREAVASSSLRFIRSSSAALPAPVRAALEQVFNAPVVESYGMTEAAHQITSDPLPPGRHKAGSVGLAAGPEVAIVDEAGNALPPGRLGEIVIRGPSVMKGYDGGPAANAGVFVNGWLRTGDQGRRDEEGYLFITGRLKELINRGGAKIAPHEVDAVLMEHPAVARAVTFPVPHDALGEEIGAAIVLRDGASASERTIRAFVAGRLADFKVPSRLVIVPSIPTGPSGKYQRRALAEQLGLLEPTGASRSGRAPHRSVPALDLLEAQLTQIWESLFGTRPIGVTDDFFHLGGHSLLAARMLDEVEQVCGWTVPPSTLYAAPTIELLAHQLMARRGATDSGSSLVAVQAGGSRLPFVLLHGDLSGVGSYCRSLAGHLGPDQPFYVLPPHGSNGDEAPPTIEVMAEDFLAKVRAAFPDGRYVLGGFSNGGLVAFEMARRLQARGRPIPLLVVIDMPVEHPRWRLLRGPIESLGRLCDLDAADRRDLFRLWKYRVKRVRGLALAGPSAQVAFVLAKAGGNRRPMARPSSAGAPSERQLVGQRWRHMLDTYDPIIDAYVPRRYPGRIALIASADRAARFPRDPTMGWGRVARKVRVLSVPGEHLTCVTTHADVLAERLRVCLDEVRS